MPDTVSALLPPQGLPGPLPTRGGAVLGSLVRGEEDRDRQHLERGAPAGTASSG